MDRPEESNEPRERADLHEYVLSEFEKPVTPEQVKRLDRELVSTAEFFRLGGIDFYVAGGSGLDLLDGEWERDHQDLDVIIREKDRERFYELAKREGFFVTDHERVPLSKEEILDSRRHNCFTFRNQDGLQEGFETIFLAEGEDASYEEAPVIERGTQRIRLQPPEVTLFHKLIDGRRKDLRDIRRVWSTLDEVRKRDVQRQIDEAGIRFKIGSREETSVERLLASAPEIQKEKDIAFFGNNLAHRIRREIEEQAQRIAIEVLALRQGATSQEELMERFEKKYKFFTPERRVVMEQMADVLFQQPIPDQESFSAWVRMVIGGDIQERLKQRAAYEFKEEKLWETV